MSEATPYGQDLIIEVWGGSGSQVQQQMRLPLTIPTAIFSNTLRMIMSKAHEAIRLFEHGARIAGSKWGSRTTVTVCLCLVVVAIAPRSSTAHAFRTIFIPNTTITSCMSSH